MPAHSATAVRHLITVALVLGQSNLAVAQSLDASRFKDLDQRATALQPKMVEWRRDIHQHPELSGQEVRTAQRVADHLRALGMEVRTGVGGHGVVGVLTGAQPGKVVALRADMDALPVPEDTGLPFASKVVGRHMGKDAPVMHACGHDGHTAILMGVAEMLAGIRAHIPGAVKFVFQPAEEGLSEHPADPTVAFGAKAMVEQGALDSPKVDAIFGLHLLANGPLPSGSIGYRSGPLSASADGLRVRVTGRQSHGAMPWKGIDPIVTSAYIITGLQSVVSRQLDISKEPVVLTIGAINGGNRENIIPESVEMLGSLRTFDEAMRTEAKERIATTAQSIGAASGAKVEVRFGADYGGVSYSLIDNSAALTQAAAPVLRAISGNQATVVPKITGSEDFSEFQKVVPGFFFLLYAPPKGKTSASAAPNHSPAFDFDEDAMAVGAKALAALALDYLTAQNADAAK